VTAEAEAKAQGTLDALVEAAHGRGIPVERSQVRRTLHRENVRWRTSPSWGDRTAPDVVPKGPTSSRSM
jgi:hypothetical protein